MGCIINAQHRTESTAWGGHTPSPASWAPRPLNTLICVSSLPAGVDVTLMEDGRVKLTGSGYTARAIAHVCGNSMLKGHQARITSGSQTWSGTSQGNYSFAGTDVTKDNGISRAATERIPLDGELILGLEHWIGGTFNGQPNDGGGDFGVPIDNGSANVYADLEIHIEPIAT